MLDVEESAYRRVSGTVHVICAAEVKGPRHASVMVGNCDLYHARGVVYKSPSHVCDNAPGSCTATSILRRVGALVVPRSRQDFGAEVHTTDAMVADAIQGWAGGDAGYPEWLGRHPPTTVRKLAEAVRARPALVSITLGPLHPDKARIVYELFRRITAAFDDRDPNIAAAKHRFASSIRTVMGGYTP